MAECGIDLNSLGFPMVEITEDSEDETPEVRASPRVVQEQSSQLLADALKRMDGLIGDFRPPSELMEASIIQDPLVIAIVQQANGLCELMSSWDHSKPSDQEGHPKDCISVPVRETIINWLCSKRMGSPHELERLQTDKGELLKQVVGLQQQLDSLHNDRDKLSNKVADLERRVIEKEEHIRSLGDELRATKTSLQTKEVEVRQLHSEIKNGVRPSVANDKYKRVTIHAPPQAERSQPINRKGSFRLLGKRFKKKEKSTSQDQVGAPTSPVRPVNPRASAFYSMTCDQMSDWFSSVGLDMYSDLVLQNLLTGEILAGMVSRPGTAEFVKMGIVSTLHCKKLRLAVEDAVAIAPSPVSGLDHNWVGEWLVDIGLPQYQRTFMDARFDGRMLDVITMDDLYLLEVNSQFHLTSIKRAIQALRMCGYDPNYLKDQKSQGSQKLLHWSAGDVVQWVCGIELDDYTSGLSGTGVHGAIMLLDVQFTSESLAKALGVSSSKTLIRTHLSRKFMELLGPVAAQDKVDALQTKSFVHYDPTEVPKARPRLRSTGSRRGRAPLPEVLLCPFDQFPAADPAVLGRQTRSNLTSPTSSRSTISDHSARPLSP